MEVHFEDYSKDLRRLYQFALDRQAGLRGCARTSLSIGVHARALGSVRITILMCSVGGGSSKVIEFRKGVRADSLAPFLPVRRAHFAMRILRERISTRTIQHRQKILTVNWNACTRRSASSTDRPTGRSFIVICLRDPTSAVRPTMQGENQAVYLSTPLGSMR